MSEWMKTAEEDIRSLLTRQLAMFTTGETEGAQSVSDMSSRPWAPRPARPPAPAYKQISGGSGEPNVNRFRSAFLDRQYRREQSLLGYSDMQGRLLERLAALLREPRGRTVSDLLDQFWRSWKALTHDHGQVACTHVLEQGHRLTRAFRVLTRALRELAAGIDRDIDSRTSLVNEFAARVADLNRRIADSEAGGQAAPWLREKRSRTLDELARLCHVEIEETYTGAMNVRIGDTELVHATEYRRLSTTCGPPDAGGRPYVIWEYSGRAVPFSGGELEGLVLARDGWLPEIEAALDALVHRMVTQVNALHRRGVTAGGHPGVDFFDPQGLTARSVQLHGWTADKTGERVVVGRTCGQGDKEVAQALAGLADRAAMPDGRSTLGDFYESVASTIASRGAAAQDMAETQRMLVKQLANHRQSVSGTSLDLERHEMIKLQHASLAAARVMKTMDDALNTVADGMGIVDR